MNISKLKIVWCYLTGGGTKVIDYVIDVANNAVNGLNESSKDKVREVFDAIGKILSTARSMYWLVPSKWQSAFSATLEALDGVRAACDDMAVSREELDAIVVSWAKAYSAWRAE